MKIKKFAAFLAALMLVMAAGSACALTMTGFDGDTSARDWASSLFFARMEALTGVAVQPQGVSQDKEYDQLLADMAKGKLPADVLFKANLTRTQERALLDGGALIDLAPMIEENMPNLSALLEAHPEWKAAMSLEDGRIASLPLLNDRERQVCVWINTEWLNALGLEMPQNVTQLTEALVAMKDKDPNGNFKPDEVAVDMLGVWEMRWLLPYFGIVADDYNIARVDGKAVFAPEMPGYRAFIELLCDWNQKGLFREDAFLGAHSAAAYDAQDKEASALSGIMVSVTPITHVPIDDVMAYEALIMPGPDGETVWRDYLGSVWTGTFAVTSACEDPASALKWADALYAEEGVLLAYAGIEGEDYTYNEAGNWVFVADAARTIDTIRQNVLMYTGTAMPGIVPNDFLSKVDSAPDKHVIAQSAKVGGVAKQVNRPYALHGEAQARAYALSSEIGALVDKGIARFVTGEVPLSDETYAAWLSELAAAGSAELVEIFDQVKAD